MKHRYIIRLDDAAERMDLTKWNRVEAILDEFHIKPLVGVIPLCKDPEMQKYDRDVLFWDKVKSWNDKGWEIAVHGYEHLYHTEDGGLNPVQKRSEFAGLSLETQREKIKNAYKIFRDHELNPKVFFAPSHTFDKNTLRAIKAESDIRIISDTVSDNRYDKFGMTFVPVQTGKGRQLPYCNGCISSQFYGRNGF